VLNSVSISLAEFNGKVESIELVDMTGKLVKVKPISDSLNTLNLDMGDLNSGVYIMKLNTDQGQFQQKLIKQ
jgi:hypothetical protein